MEKHVKDKLLQICTALNPNPHHEGGEENLTALPTSQIAE
jgi:hypothetical protein